MNVGKNIAALRKSANLTQEQLAEKCGVSRQAVTKWETGESEPSIERLIMLSKVFQVTIDELITGKSFETVEDKGIENKCINFKEVKYCISNLSSVGIPNIDFYRTETLSTAGLLLEFLKNQYIDSNGNVYERYLIENTTREEREKDVQMINKFVPIQKYVDGKCEIVEALDEASDEIFDKCSRLGEIYEKKLNSKEMKLGNLINGLLSYAKYQNILTATAQEEMRISEKLKDQLKQIREAIEEIGTETFWGRFFNFWFQETEAVYKNKDMKKMDELNRIGKELRNFVLTQVCIEETNEIWDNIVMKRSILDSSLKNV